jgi:hypothetical protein
MLRTLLAFAVLLLASGVSAQRTSFLLINGTAYPISQLSVSESLMNIWGPNELHPPVLKAGERRQVTFNAPVTFCQADFRVTFADGGAPAVWQNLNICTLSRIKLVYDRMSGITTASYDE